LLAVLGTAVLVAIGSLAFDLAAPANAVKVLLAWTPGALSLGAIGLLIGRARPE
jgi:ABC-2 type transport system permease protein